MEKYYTHALVSIGVLEDAVDRQAIVGWLAWRFGHIVAEEGYQVFTNPVVHFQIPDLQHRIRYGDCLKATIFGRIVKVQNVEPQQEMQPVA